MKTKKLNKIVIKNDYAVLVLKKRCGEIVECLIDIEEIEKLEQLGSSWSLKENNVPYVKTNIVIDGVNTTLRLHRFIMGVTDRNIIIDHINFNTLDNRKSNLRIVTSAQNNQNRNGAQKNSKSGIRGVSWDKKTNKWRVTVKVNKRQICVGYFSDLKDAAISAENARKTLLPFSTN